MAHDRESELNDLAGQRHSKVGPVALWRMKRAFQIKFLLTQGLQPHHYVLDLGCGTLRGGIPIIDHLNSEHYAGIDVRRDVLDEGRKELIEAGLEWKRPQLLHASELYQVEFRRQFDFIWAFSVLIHMTDTILDSALLLAAKYLAPQGRFFANIHLGPRPDQTWGEFPVVARAMDFYTASAARRGLQVFDLGALTTFGHILPDRSIEEQNAQRMLEFRHSPTNLVDVTAHSTSRETES